MALELAKIAKINLVRSVTWIFFNGLSSNFVTLFVGIISWVLEVHFSDHKAVSIGILTCMVLKNSLNMYLGFRNIFQINISISLLK